MIKAGVIGAGHLGKIHLRLLEASNRYELVGFYDSDNKNAKILSSEKGYRLFDSMKELIDACDMIDIVTPTVFHHDVSLQAIACLLYTSPSPRDGLLSRMPSSA